jgi:2'-5' RNA ligase
MPLAVTLRPDRIVASAVEDMWSKLAARGMGSAPRHAPHITLAIFPDNGPVHRIRRALARTASGVGSIPVKLHGFGLFPGPPAVLWLAPVVTPALLGLHSQVHRALADVKAHPDTLPGAWVPHFTLAYGMASPEHALTAVLPIWKPRTGLLEHLELLRFDPVEVLETWRLLS